MAQLSNNLATRSPAEQLATAADLIARRLLHYRKDKGKAWRLWTEDAICNLRQDYQQPVRNRLNELLRGSK